MQKCLPPATRCLGFNGTGPGFSDPASLCGAGFDGAKCAGCAAGFYEDDRQCKPCGDESGNEKFMPLILGGVFLVVLALVVAGLVHLGQKWKSQGSKHDPLMEAGDFVVWVVLLLQTLMQVSSAGTDLPPAVKSVNEFLSVVLIDFATLHPACSSLIPAFGIETFTFLSALLLLSVVSVLRFGKSLALHKRRRRATFTDKKEINPFWSRLRHITRSSCFKMLAVMYAPTMNFAFNSILCQDVEEFQQASSARRDGVLLNRRMLKAHPYYECSTGPKGPHCFGLPVYGLALATLVLVGIAYPLSTFLTLLRMQKDREDVVLSGDERALRMWEEMVEYEWQHEYWFFNHLHVLQSFVLAFNAGWFVTADAADGGTTGAWGAGLDAVMVSLLLLAYLKVQPYRENQRWKHGIQKMLLSTALLLALVLVAGTLAAERKAQAGGEADGLSEHLSRFAAVISVFVLGLMAVLMGTLCKSFWDVVVLEKRELSDAEKSRRHQKTAKVILIDFFNDRWKKQPSGARHATLWEEEVEFAEPTDGRVRMQFENSNPLHGEKSASKRAKRDEAEKQLAAAAAARRRLQKLNTTVRSAPTEKQPSAAHKFLAKVGSVSVMPLLAKMRSMRHQPSTRPGSPARLGGGGGGGGSGGGAKHGALPDIDEEGAATGPAPNPERLLTAASMKRPQSSLTSLLRSRNSEAKFATAAFSFAKTAGGRGAGLGRLSALGVVAVDETGAPDQSSGRSQGDASAVSFMRMRVADRSQLPLHSGQTQISMFNGQEAAEL